MPSSSHNVYSFLIIAVLLVGFFPGVFHYVTRLPFQLLSPYHAETSSDPQRPEPSTTTTTTTTPPTMAWSQKQFSLPSRSRGSYLVTDHVVDSLPEIKDYKVGLLNLFVQHTSCALSLNENWDEDVRADMSDALDRIAPESGPKGQDLYRHSAEGADDMPVGDMDRIRSPGQFD
jgi:thiamine phosphate synthase YjbQ (UPF0047 family)